MDFSEKLYKLRTNSNCSQETLAEQLDVSRQAVSKWEQGVTLPEIDKIIAIADFFDVSIDYLLKNDVQLGTSDGLDRLIIRFLGYAQDMDNLSMELVDIVKDGIIDATEKERMNDILKTLDKISGVINDIKSKLNLNK